MRILVAVPYYAPAIGGVETYSQAVIERLRKDGHTVKIITTKLADKKTSAANDKKNSIHRLSPWFKLSNTPINLFWYFQIRRIILDFDPDVMHVHSPVPFLADMVVLAAKKRVPVLMTYHSGSMKKGNGIIDKCIGFYEKRVLPAIFRRTNKIGAVLPEFVKKLADPNKIEFTPPGIDTAIYKPNKALKRTVDIVFAGRIESTSAWKGLDVFLKAVAKVKERHPHVVVQVIGQGDAVAIYKKLAQKLSLENTVSFVTDRQGPQMVSVYQQAKIIALPSKTEAESFGMVLAEAMACGVAPVGSRIGGIPNLIQHEVNGLLVAPNNIDALAQAFIRLLEDSSYRKKLARQAELSVNRQFTLDTMTEKTSALLYEITKKKIVHVSAYYPPHLGGMEAAISMLATKQYENAYNVSVVSSDIGVTKPPRSAFPVAYLPAVEIASTPVMPALFWKLLKQSQRSIFHVHVAQAGIPEIAFLAAKLKRFPIILHLHGDVEASSAAGFLLPLYKKVFLGFVLRRANTVIVPTENYRKTMSSRYKLRNPVHVLPAGIDRKFFDVKSSRDGRAPFKVLFVGRLTVEKNVAMLIEAVQQVSSPIHFTIVGDGVLKEALQKQAKTNMPKECTITFAGKRSSDELMNYYAHADVLVLASNYESQSLVVLEAMAAGVPVIVANVAAVNEIVGTAGLLVDKAAGSFTEAITYLIENPTKRSTYSKKGIQRAKEFDWDLLLPKLEEIYDDLEK